LEAISPKLFILDSKSRTIKAPSEHQNIRTIRPSEQSKHQHTDHQNTRTSNQSEHNISPNIPASTPNKRHSNWTDTCTWTPNKDDYSQHLLSIWSSIADLPAGPARRGPGRPGPARPGPGQPGPARPGPCFIKSYALYVCFLRSHIFVLFIVTYFVILFPQTYQRRPQTKNIQTGMIPARGPQTTMTIVNILYQSGPQRFMESL